MRIWRLGSLMIIVGLTTARGDNLKKQLRDEEAQADNQSDMKHAYRYLGVDIYNKGLEKPLGRGLQSGA